jgi:hypothetical protein
VWSLEVVPLNDIWEEQTASLANLSKIELAQTITTLKKVHILILWHNQQSTLNFFLLFATIDRMCHIFLNGMVVVAS